MSVATHPIAHSFPTRSFPIGSLNLLSSYPPHFTLIKAKPLNTPQALHHCWRLAAVPALPSV